MKLFARSKPEPQEVRGLSVSAEAAFAEGSTCSESATPQTALSLSYVYASMYIISSSLAQLPLKVLKRENDIVKPDTDHPVSKLVSFRPNQFQSSYKWRETEQFRCLGWGNAYTEIKRVRGRVVGLQTHAPWMVSLQENLNTGNYYFLVYSDELKERGSRVVALEDMIHIKDIGYDEKTGVSRIKQNASTVDWGLAMQDYGTSFFGSNGRPTGMVTPKIELNAESWATLKGAWSKAVNAMSSGNKTALLPAELQYTSFTIPPEDMQYLESRQFSRSEVASIFNVPPHMIGALENATFSNISEQALQYVKYTIMPWVVLWEEEMNYKLFTEAELKAGYYVKFNLAGLLRGTPKDRADFYKIMIDSGVYSRQEVRAMEDMNPIDGLDDMVISTNMKSTAMMKAEAEIKQKEADADGQGTENA